MQLEHPQKGEEGGDEDEVNSLREETEGGRRKGKRLLVRRCLFALLTTVPA